MAASHIHDALQTEIKDHLRTISEAHGATGFESQIRDQIAAAWRPLTDEITVNRMGNLYATRRANRKRADSDQENGQPSRKIMLCAHMDEVGFIVRQITEEGYLLVNMLGYPDARIMPGKRAIVHGKRDVTGIFTVLPQFAQPADQKDKYPRTSNLFLDLCMSANRVHEAVTVGDWITMDTPLLELKNDRVAGKTLDNRACVAAITAALKLLQERVHGWDVVAVASVQEEQTLLGARVAAYEINPDIAIVLDVTFAKQPGGKPPTFALGGGPTLALGPNLHPLLYDAIKASAERVSIPLTPEVQPGETGTDAVEVQIAREGIPTALLQVPLRNMHTTIETVDMKDVLQTGAVMAEFIAGLPTDFLLDPDLLP